MNCLLMGLVEWQLVHNACTTYANIIQFVLSNFIVGTYAHAALSDL